MRETTCETPGCRSVELVEVHFDVLGTECVSLQCIFHSIQLGEALGECAITAVT